VETTLVDSNVLLDIATDDPEWSSWSTLALARALEEGGLAINPIIYAEVSVRYASIEELEYSLPVSTYARLPLPWEAGFLAGKCFARYKTKGGIRRSPLPDFFVGAHAAVSGFRLLTRDASRYRTYFPGLRLISPGSKTA